VSALSCAIEFCVAVPWNNSAGIVSAVCCLKWLVLSKLCQRRGQNGSKCACELMPRLRKLGWLCMAQALQHIKTTIQRVQNALARVVTYMKRAEHIFILFFTIYIGCRSIVALNTRWRHSCLNMVNEQPCLPTSCSQWLHPYTTSKLTISTPSFQACCSNLNGKTFVQPGCFLCLE
jgi:hypothetical protein